MLSLFTCKGCKQLKGLPQQASSTKTTSLGRWKCQPLLQLKNTTATRTGLALCSYLRNWASHPNGRLLATAVPGTSEQAVHLTQHQDLGQGLYGIPGLTQPEGFFQLCEEAEAACTQLLQHIVALDVLGTHSRGNSTQDANEGLEAKLDELVAAYEFAVASCKLPAAHCREHHEAPEWRLAARLAEEEQLQPLSQALYRVLSRHCVWGRLQQRRQGDSNSSSSSRTAIEPQEHQQGTDRLQQQQQQQQVEVKEQGLDGETTAQQQEGDRRPSKELQQIRQLQQDAVLASTFLKQQEQQDLRSLEAIEEELKEVAELVFMAAEGPVLVLDWRSEVHGDGLLAQLCHPLPDSLAEGQRQQQQEAQGSDAGCEVGCSLACILDALEAEQQAMRAEQSRAGGLLGLGGVRAGKLPTGETLTLGHVAFCSPKAVLQVQRWQMAQTGPPPQLAALPLSPRLSSALVASHPSPAMRRLAYQAGVAPRVNAFWGVLDALRSVRDAISAFQGYPSYAHRAWAGTSAGAPAAVVRFLRDMAAALQPMAEAELGQLSAFLPAAVSSSNKLRAEQQQQQQQQRPPASESESRAEEKQWSRAGSKIDPWDLEFAQEAASSHVQTRGSHTPMPPWSSLAHLFPLQASLSVGLSQILAPAGLHLTLEPWTPSREPSNVKNSTSDLSPAEEGSGSGAAEECWRGASPCLKLLLYDTHSRREEWVARDPRAEHTTDGGAQEAPRTKCFKQQQDQNAGHTKGGGAQEAGLDASARVPDGGVRGAFGVQGALASESYVGRDESYVGKEEAGREVVAKGEGARGQLLGVIYCACDPECGMPFAQLIRPGTGEHSATLSAVGLQRLSMRSHGNSLPHVAIHLPADALYLAPGGVGSRNHQHHQQQQQQPTLLMKGPELLKLVLHEMGHAISMILSAHTAPSSVFGNVGFASTDVQELSAHVLERCAYDAHSLVALSGGRAAGTPSTPSTVRNSPAPIDDFYGDGQRLHLSDAAQLAEHLQAHSAIELHQQVLLAIADLRLHSCGAGDKRSPEGAADASPGSDDVDMDQDNHSLTSKDIVQGVWHKHGVIGTRGPACTQQVLRLLPRLLHTPALMAAYPMCDVLAAAIWKQHALCAFQRPFPEFATKAYDCGSLLNMPNGAPERGWLAVREFVFEAGAGADLESMAVGLLGAQCMHRVPLLRGSDTIQSEGALPSCGVVPDLASDVFQGIDL